MKESITNKSNSIPIIEDMIIDSFKSSVDDPPSNINNKA